MFGCLEVCDVSDAGYIKLYRKIWDNQALSDGERFDRMSAWLWILTHANYKDGSFIKNGCLQHVKRGQLFTSIRYLALAWGWDRKTVARFLGAMETEKMITVTGLQKGTLITVRNYNKYQASEVSGSEEGATEGATEWTADSTSKGTTEGATTKEVKKNIRRQKKETRGRRVIE